MAAAVTLLPESRRELLVALSRVSKDYDTGGGIVHAMRDVSLSIAYGEFVAIVGASGSGKSTMMNILGCLDRPTRGTYTLAGIDVGSRQSDSRAIVRNRIIGFIFQGFNLLPRTTALENCELPLQYRGVGARARHARAKAALAAVGLADRMDHTTIEPVVGGGQQQRVAIARALVTDPPLLLADEPTGNLDSRTSLEVLALLQTLNRDRGITIILVTHERDIAACASRVITMRDAPPPPPPFPPPPPPRRVVSDVVQDALPGCGRRARADADRQKPGPGKPRSETDDADRSHARARERIPLRVYGAMFTGARLGTIGARVLFAIAGVDEAASGANGGGWGLFAIAQAMGLLAEAWLGASSARRRLGPAPTSEQRARIALWYTVATAVGAGLVLLALTFARQPGLDQRLAHASLLAALIEHVSHRGATVIALACVVFHAMLVLLRYLLLTLFSARR